MKRFLFFAAAGLLLALGCQREAVEIPQDGDLVTASISVSIPASMATKEPGQGALIKELLFRAYDAEGNHLQALDRTKEVSGQTVHLQVPLLRGVGYKLVFWAQAKDQYTISEDQNGHPVISIPDSQIAEMMNEEAYDAFYAVKDVEPQKKGLEEMKVSLKRPFALLSLGVSPDDLAPVAASYDIETLFQSQFALTGSVPNTLDLFTGEVSGQKELFFNYKDVPVDNIVSGQKTFRRLAMMYVLAPAASEAGQGGLLISSGAIFIKVGEKGKNDYHVFHDLFYNVPLKRNYCTNILGNIFSVNGSLTVNMEDFDTPDIPVPLDDEHESVDMGNGLKWATCNVGAENPWDYGDFFAWGETATKANYCLDTYLWSNQTSFTKYTTFGTTLESADDAATANWGGAWRTPTVAEWAWLLENSNSEWTDNYEGKGVSGRIVTSTVNGNQIFLPIAGYWDSDIHTGKKFGLYWSSTLDDFSLTDAEYVLVSGGNINIDHACRFFGQSVRPVTD